MTGKQEGLFCFLKRSKNGYSHGFFGVCFFLKGWDKGMLSLIFICYFVYMCVIVFVSCAHCVFVSVSVCLHVHTYALLLLFSPVQPSAIVKRFEPKLYGVLKRPLL